MTLILTCLTASAVIQISDRRLTRLAKPGGPVSVVTDETVKVVFADSWLYGYTGLAELSGVKTHYWLAERLARRVGQRHGDCIADIFNDVTESINLANVKYPRLARIAQAFVGAGWQMDTTTGIKFPTLYEISNFHDIDGRACQVGDFNIAQCTLQQDERALIHAIGARVEVPEIARLKLSISRIIDRSGGVQSIGRIMVDFMRMIYQRDETVGSNLMLSCVPISHFNSQILGMENPYLTGLPQENYATFCSFDESGYSEVTQAPIIVMNGSITEMSVHPTPII